MLNAVLNAEADPALLLEEEAFIMKNLVQTLAWEIAGGGMSPCRRDPAISCGNFFPTELYVYEAGFV